MKAAAGWMLLAVRPTTIIITQDLLTQLVQVQIEITFAKFVNSFAYHQTNINRSTVGGDEKTLTCPTMHSDVEIS